MILIFARHGIATAHLLKRIKRISATPDDFPDLVQRPINPLAGLRSLSLAGVVHLIQKGKCTLLGSNSTPLYATHM
jgi:hypothetical protein